MVIAAQRRWLAFVAGALVLGLAPVGHAQVTVTVDANADRKPISPLIYGVHFANTAQLQDMNATVNRLGGNSVGRYNWQQNIDNRGADYFFMGFPYANTPGGYGNNFITGTKAGGAEPFLSMPMVGWVAKTDVNRNPNWSFSVADYGPFTGTNAADGFPDAGNGCKAGAPLDNFHPCGGIFQGGTARPFTDNDPNDASMPADGAFQQGWMQHVVNTHGPANAGGLKYWGLDNEATIWHQVYWDVHPVGASAAEYRDKMFDYGSRIKAVDPGAQVLAPEEWGWDGYFYSGFDQQLWGRNQCSGFDCPDRVSIGGDYVPWLLAQAKQYQDDNGVRILDMLTLHIYPQGGEVDNGGSDVSQAMQEKRNRSTRSLWDASYVDESWINTEIRLIPRMRDWVNGSYPGTKIGLTEYDWGADNHINGATAQADLLGIFGREGVDMAIRWNVIGAAPISNSLTYNAFKMYRNYDGNKSTFGETSVSATVPQPDNVAAFAAERADGKLTVMVINKQTIATTATVNLANFNATSPAEVWRLDSTNAIQSLPGVTVPGNSFSSELPPQTITLFVVSPAVVVPVTADLAITKTDGQTETFPGQPLIYTITATNNGPDGVTGATVADDVPASLTGVVWSCSGAGGGQCGSGAGAGDINDTVNLPSGGSVTYFLQATVAANPGPVRNTATITPPAGVTDPVPANNSATDDDFLVCHTYRTIVPDGRGLTSSLASGESAWVLANLRTESSYTVEAQNTLGTGGAPTVTVFRGDDGCSGTSTAGAVDTSNVAPGAPASSRWSFIADSIDPIHRLRVQNGTGGALGYRLQVAETTLQSPSWSTGGTEYNTYFSLQNTTEGTIGGTITLRDAAGTVVASQPLSIPAGATAAINTEGLNVPRGRTGTATFAHNGPPGAVQAAAATANFDFVPAYVQTVKFEPVRDRR